MIKSVLLGSVAVGMTVFATGASAKDPTITSQNITPQLGRTETTNEVMLIQRSVGNKASIDQTGTNNKAGDINGSTIDLSIGSISTDTYNSYADSVRSILQNGDTNNLSVVQAGQNNSIATVANNRTNNFGGVSLASGSFQQGTRNDMSVNQQGTGSTAQFQQLNNYNVGQIAVQSGTNNNYAGVFQYQGDSNEGRIYQNTGTTNSSSIIEQQGSSNRAFVTQASLNENGSIGQYGDHNLGVINQSGGGNQDALILQFGNFHQAYVTQTGGGQQAFVTQSGNGNIASVNQSGADFNYAAIRQTDSGNNATINQTNSINIAAAYQTGGSGNNSGIQQDGYGVGAFTYQNGNNNSAQINQALGAISANAGLVQIGTSNQASIRQH